MKRVSRPLAAPDLAAQIPGPTLAEGRHQGALRALRLTPRCCTGDTPTWFPRLVTARMASKGPDRGVSLRTPHCLCRRGTWPSPRTPSSLSHLDYQQLPAISPPAPSITPPPPPPSSPPQFHPPPPTHVGSKTGPLHRREGETKASSHSGLVGGAFHKQGT